MKHRFVVFVATFFLFVSTQCLQAEPLKESPYYPLAVGTEWVYELTAGGQVNIISVKVVKHEKVGEVMCARVESSRDNVALAAEYVTIDDDGVHRVKSLDFLSVPPLLFLKMPVKKGETWMVKSAVAGTTISGEYSLTIETMEVPAGEYKEVAVVKSPKLNVGMQVWDQTTTYAKNVGLIYQKILVNGQVLLEQKLKEYRPAKKTE